MTTTETPFIRYWRALNAELVARGAEPATAGAAKARLSRDETPQQAAAWIAMSRAAFRSAVSNFPPHTRNAGKDFTS